MPVAGRSLTGQTKVNASSIHLAEYFQSANGFWEGRMKNILEIFLREANLNKNIFDSNSEHPAGQASIAQELDTRLAQYRRSDVPIELSQINNLFSFLAGMYRGIGDNYFPSISLSIGGASYDLSTYLGNISREIVTKRTSQLFQNFEFSYKPAVVNKNIKLSKPQTTITTENSYTCQISKTVRRARYQTLLLTENNVSYNLTKSDPGYTLAFGDGTASAVYDGRISLLKGGTVVQTIQAVPSPLNQQGMLMSVDSAGTLFYENAGAHTAAHGNFGGSGSGSDNFIGSLDFLSSSGHIRAITTPNQVSVTTPQSLDSKYVTVSQHGLDIGISNGLHSLRASEVAALQARCTALEARCTALEAAALTFKGANGATPVPVKQIQIASDLEWAYYPTGQILWIEKDPPVASNPYSFKAGFVIWLSPSGEGYKGFLKIKKLEGSRQPDSK